VRVLCQIRGVGRYTAMLVIAEVGEATRFPTARHLCAWAGLTPTVRSSDGKARLGHISHQGSPALRWALTEAAQKIPTSSVTLARMPLVAVYTASKTAIEGFTASLALELEDLNVTVKLVEPGYGPSTNFMTNVKSPIEELIPEAYAPFAQRVMADFQQPSVVTRESDVAQTVWRAANDTTGQLRFPAGPDAVARCGSCRHSPAPRCARSSSAASTAGRPVPLGSTGSA
jgi:NAD(P)-dependent dehydrogenase (short-subunit alcohol dehydrogenase family)